MCLFPIEIERLMGLGSGRIECRKLFYRMPFRLHFYDPLERVLVEIAEGLALLSRLPTSDFYST